MPLPNPEDLDTSEMAAVLSPVPKDLLEGATAVLAKRVGDAYLIWESVAQGDYYAELPRIPDYAWSRFDSASAPQAAPCDKAEVARIQDEQQSEWPELIEECVKVLYEALAILETTDVETYALGVARAFGDHQYFAQLMDSALQEAGFDSSVENEELEVQRALFALFDTTTSVSVDEFRALWSRPISWKDDFKQVKEL